MTRILGIDPGLQCTGWGVIDVQGNALTYVASGIIKPPTRIAFAERLQKLHERIQQVVHVHKPGEAAIEETFVNVNGASTLKLGQARGALLLSLALAHLPISEYSATKVKKSVVGVGRAEKGQVGMMVRQLLPGCDVSQPDEADALAIAICHTSHRVLRDMTRLAEAE